MDTRKINQIVSEVASNIAGMTPGTTITHLVLSEQLQVDRLTEPGSYYSRVTKLKNELIRQHGIFLRTEHKIGYAVVLPGEEIQLCEGEYIRGYKTMRRAIGKTGNIRVEKITDQAKRTETIQKAQLMANKIGLLKMGASSPAAVTG